MKEMDYPLMEAFVDGELTGADLEQAMQRLDADPDFKRGVCELRTFKELVRNAYDLPDESAFVPARRSLTGWPQALAASLLLAIGVGGGWVLRGQTDSHLAEDTFAGMAAGEQISTLVSQMDAPSVLLHLDSSDPDRIRVALASAERLARRNDRARIDILVNSHGLNLVRAESSRDGERINELLHDYPNIRFVACEQTMQRFRDAGASVTLLPKVLVVDSALGELSRRVQNGWVYVHA
jgi:uncharacterized protein